MGFFSELVEGLFFQADNFTYWTPSHMGIDYDEFNVETKRGLALNCIFMPALNKLQGTIVFCHAGLQNLSNHIVQVCWFPRQGYNVLMFDYRGFGKSKGKIALKHTTEDLSCILDKCVLNKNKSELGNDLILYGQFMGADAILRLIAERPELLKRVTKIVIESAFMNHEDYLLSKYGPGLGHVLTFFLPQDLKQAEDGLRLINIPITIIVPARDGNVPDKQSDAVMNCALPQKTIIYATGQKFLQPMRIPGVWREALLDSLRIREKNNMV